MKTKNTFYLIAIIVLLLSNLSYGQRINEIADPMKNSKTKIVQQLNTPTKIWVNGGWRIKNDGTRVWQKGHWSFEEKTFQKKSELFATHVFHHF
jgi:hypothetical protein